jgi:hypothetical protein
MDAMKLAEFIEKQKRQLIRFREFYAIGIAARGYKDCMEASEWEEQFILFKEVHP